jgi:ubiquinone/menaquinone biosynthesis C-methylase UbiE
MIACSAGDVAIWQPDHRCRQGSARHHGAASTDAARLAFVDGCFGAVAALWMLYYVPQPFIVLAEAARVLRAGGVFVACTSSRYNDPEFAEVMPGWGGVTKRGCLIWAQNAQDAAPHR